MKLTTENILLGFIAILSSITCVLIIQYYMIDDEEILDFETMTYLSSIEHYVEKDIEFDKNKNKNINIEFYKKRIFTQKEINSDLHLSIYALLQISRIQ